MVIFSYGGFDMTIKEAEEFYKNDTKDYRLKENPKFISWFRKTYKNVHPYLNIDEVQKLVDKVINWYEIKFPNRFLETFNGVINSQFENIENIEKHLTLEQLKYRLHHGELQTLNCYYRSGCGGGDSILIDVTINNTNVNIFASQEGTVRPNYILEYIVSEIDKPMTLEQLYNTLVGLNLKNSDLSNLKRCIDIHDKDMNLKKIILGAIVKGMIFSRETSPEFGLKRAKTFIDDIEANKEELILSQDIKKLLIQ